MRLVRFGWLLRRYFSLSSVCLYTPLSCIVFVRCNQFLLESIFVERSSIGAVHDLIMTDNEDSDALTVNLEVTSSNAQDEFLIINDINT